MWGGDNGVNNIYYIVPSFLDPIILTHTHAQTPLSLSLLTKKNHSFHKFIIHFYIHTHLHHAIWKYIPPITNKTKGAQESLSLAKTRIFNRQNLRPPTIFFGIGEEQPFYVERVPSLITARVTHNISFFYLNYMAVTVVLFALTLLISPSAIIGIGLLGFAWLGLIRATAEGSIVVKGTSYIFRVCGGGGGMKCYIPRSSHICLMNLFCRMCAFLNDAHLLLLSIFYFRTNKQGSPLPKNRPRLPCRGYPSWCWFGYWITSFGWPSARPALYAECTACYGMPACTRTKAIAWSCRAIWVWMMMMMGW